MRLSPSRFGLSWKLLIPKVICSFLLLFRVEAVVINHGTDVSNYRALAAAAPFAGIVEIEVDGTFGTRRGSGVVVGDQWILTAAHVTSGAGAGSVRVRSSGTSMAAVDLRYAAGWSGSPAPGLNQGSDLVLVRLDKPLGVGSARIASSVATGEVGFLGGYGRTGNGVLGASGSAELLFAMNVIDRRISAGAGGLLVTDFDDGSSNRNSLDATDAFRTHYDVGFGDPKLSTTVLDSGSAMSDAAWDFLPTAADFLPGLAVTFLEGTTAPGDSGGPLFVFDAAADEWKLAGLSSWGINPLLPEGFARTDSRYGDLAFFTDLTSHRDWILETVPEPQTGGLLWIAGILLAMRRRRDS